MSRRSSASRRPGPASRKPKRCRRCSRPPQRPIPNAPARLPEVLWPVHIGPMQIDEILDNFEFLDEWEDRYRYLIELGRTLEPLPDAAHNAANKVQGCASQVWLETKVTGEQ